MKLTKSIKPDQCPVCGSALIDAEPLQDIVCVYCSTSSSSGRACPEGHFLCDSCRIADPARIIKGMVFTNSAKNSFMVAELLMNHPALPMLGCGHALIAAGSLLIALKNSPYAGVGDHEIRDAFAALEQQPAECPAVLTGVCSVAPAIGACFSLFLQVRPGSAREQKIVMESVARVSTALAGLTGPACCKAYVRASLETANAVFAERFGIALPGPASRIICRHQSVHPHGCREEKCPYFRKEKDIFSHEIHLPLSGCRS